MPRCQRHLKPDGLGRFINQDEFIDYRCKAAGDGRSTAEAENRNVITGFVNTGQVSAGVFNDAPDVEVGGSQTGVEDAPEKIAVGTNA